MGILARSVTPTPQENFRYFFTWKSLTGQIYQIILSES